MKACNDLEFLDTYWDEAKKVAVKITKELPDFKEPDIKSPNGTLMYIVNFRDLTDSWSVKDVLAKKFGVSPTLKILADKIAHMIIKGDAVNVKPMLVKIVSGRVKHFSIPKDKETIKLFEKYGSLIDRNSNPLGFGHFRWNRKAHTLTQAEINHIKKYFKL